MSLEDDVHLVMHLRMTGNLLLTDEEPTHTARAHASSTTGRRLLFVDVRRFGTGDVLLGSDALADYFASRLGVEPLSPDFTADALRDQARGRRQPVKAFLLNQERVAGVGNIYADEALFRAKIHPLRPVGTLRRPQIEALRDAVVESLERRNRRQGRLDRRLPPRRRRARLLPGPLPRPPARGRAVRPLRRHDREDASSGPRHLHLPALPAKAAGLDEDGRFPFPFRNGKRPTQPEGPPSMLQLAGGGARSEGNRRGLGRQQLLERARPVGLEQLAEAADRRACRPRSAGTSSAR